MEASDFVKQPTRSETSQSWHLPDIVRTWIRSPRGLLILAIALLGSGLALKAHYRTAFLW